MTARNDNWFGPPFDQNSRARMGLVSHTGGIGTHAGDEFMAALIHSKRVSNTQNVAVHVFETNRFHDQ